LALATLSRVSKPLTNDKKNLSILVIIGYNKNIKIKNLFLHFYYEFIMTEMVFGTTTNNQNFEPVFKKWWRTVDVWTIGFIVALSIIGIVLGLAASVPLAERNDLDAFYYVKRQAFFGSLSLIIMIVISMMSPNTVKRIAILGFVFSLIAVALLPIFGTGFGKGAVRWYSFGFGSVQPSEFLKPGFIIVAAWLMEGSHSKSGPVGVAWSFSLCILVTALLVIQPDFGQAALIVFSWGVIYFISGAPLIFILSILSLVVIVGTLAYSGSEHFARRIDGFLSPDLDPRTQIGYATNAIREGGLFGVGSGEGQVKWSLPDAHTDFIIAVAAEEFGLLLVIAIIFLYAGITLRSLSRMKREKNRFIMLAGSGLVASFAIQACINMGVAVRLLPAKGMTLPFVSYGGSSLLAGGIAMGILLCFSRSRASKL
jgi:cell division protein FtsW